MAALATVRATAKVKQVTPPTAAPVWALSELWRLQQPLRRRLPLWAAALLLLLLLVLVLAHWGSLHQQAALLPLRLPWVRHSLHQVQLQAFRGWA